MLPEQPVSARRRVLLVRDFVDISCPLETVSEHFLDGGAWLSQLFDAAGHDGDALLIQIGPRWGGALVAHEVRVELGAQRHSDGGIVIPLAWKATTMQALLPELDGEIELVPLGESECRLSLSASYVPPLALLGRGLDRALLHRVAESTVRSFLRRLATSLDGEKR